MTNQKSAAKALDMTNNRSPKNQKSAGAFRTGMATALVHAGFDLVPSADDVARRVYSRYGNQVSLPGDEVDLWLKTEAQLLTELHLTAFRSFYLT